MEVSNRRFEQRSKPCNQRNPTRPSLFLHAVEELPEPSRGIFPNNTTVHCMKDWSKILSHPHITCQHALLWLRLSLSTTASRRGTCVEAEPSQMNRLNLGALSSLFSLSCRTAQVFTFPSTGVSVPDRIRHHTVTVHTVLYCSTRGKIINNKCGEELTKRRFVIKASQLN